MNASTSLLIILRSHERIRTQYYNGITSAFPELKVDVVAKVEDADPYLADCDIIITHGPHLADKADHVFSNAKKLRWVQGIGTGVDNIADRPSLARRRDRDEYPWRSRTADVGSGGVPDAGTQPQIAAQPRKQSEAQMGELAFAALE